MNASKMFLELGYELLTYEMSKTIPRYSWGSNYGDKYLTLENSVIYVEKEGMIIIFYKEFKKYMTVEYASQCDDDREHAISIKLHNAITQQIKELGWL